MGGTLRRDTNEKVGVIGPPKNRRRSPSDGVLKCTFGAYCVPVPCPIQCMVPTVLTARAVLDACDEDPVTAPPSCGVPGVTFLFSCYNDRPTIGRAVQQALTLGREMGLDFEIVIVDDGSSDGSRELLSDLERSCPELRVVLHPDNRGYGAALRTGIRHATKEFIFYADGDLQYDVNNVGPMLRIASSGTGVDLVHGYRTVRRDPPHRVAFGKLYQIVTRLAFLLRLRDPNCGVRLMRRETVMRLPLTASSGAFGVNLISLMQRAGCKILEIPVAHRERQFGRSQSFKLRSIFEAVREVAGLWVRLFVFR